VGGFVNLRDLINWLSDIFSWQEQIMVGVMAAMAVLALIGRMVLTSGYNGELAIINMQVKNIKTRDDIEKLTNTSFGRIVKEYAGLGARGIGKIDTASIAKLMTYRSRLVFFNYQSLGRFVLGVEAAILPLGIMFVLAAHNRMDMVLASGITYGLVRIFAGLLDFEMANERYTATISHVLSRDIARFFPVDATSAIIALSADMKEMLNRQNTMYNEILGKISGEFSSQMKTSIGAMTKSVELTMESIARHEGLTAAMNKWGDAVDIAASKQAAIAATVGDIEKVMKGFSAAALEMSSDITRAAKGLDDRNDALKDDTARLAAAIEGLNATSTDLALRQGNVAQELEVISKYQRALDNSLGSYETSLQNVAASLGDALGRIVDLHTQNATNAMAEGITENLRQMAIGNNELFHRLEGLFEKLEEQGRYQTNLLIGIKESTETL